jgi:competence protein ComEC
MLAFGTGYLACFAVRAGLSGVGRLVAAAFALAALMAACRRAVAGSRPGNVSAAAVLGALAALAVAPAREEAPRRPRLDESGCVARVHGAVGRGGRVDERGSWFPLEGGPRVRVLGARSTPPPGAIVSVAGRLDAHGGLLAAGSPSAVALVAPASAFSPAAWFERLRNLCRDRIGAACPPRTARVLLAVLIGDAGMPPELREDLVRTGTLHLVAVSGTHLSLFLAGLRLFTRRLRVLVPLLVVYAGMCAFEPPVLRSLALAIGYLSGRRLGRALPQGAHLLISACVVLAFDPAAFVDAGFQLSFSAFGGILALAGPRRPDDPFAPARHGSAGRRVRRVLGDAVRAGAGATLATAPAMIWRFNRISPVGVPATILLAPLIPALLWLGALVAVFPGVRAFANLATAIIDLLAAAAGAIAELPAASLDVPRPHATALAGFAGTVALLAFSGPGRLRAGAAAACLIAGAAVLVPDRAPPGIYQLEAGRGSATLLLARGSAALVDAGPASAGVAEQILKLGVGRLDLVVLTHDHEDHAGGVPDVLGRLRIAAVAARGGRPSAPPPRADALAWHAGSRFERPGLAIRAAWPPADLAARGNDASIVIEAEVEGLTALLCGDLETPGLGSLLETARIGPADVLLLPHHGGRNDALADLILRADPAWVLLSARAGAPAEETLRLAGMTGARILGTYAGGAGAILAPR